MKLKELVAVINGIRKDISYTRSLQERWQKERRRFPILFASIEKQTEFFKEQIEALFDAEVSDESVSPHIKSRLAMLREKGEKGLAAVELQTLEDAAREAERMAKAREKEQAKELAGRVKEAMESHLPKEAKSAEKVRKLGEQLVKEIEGEKE